MEENSKLLELIEQAACSTTMLSPTDLPELENLQAILNKINESMAGLADCPEKLLAKAKGSTTDATELLAKILEEQVEDANKSVDTVTQIVTVLQSLIGQFDRASDAAEIAGVKTEITSSEKVEVEPAVAKKVEAEAIEVEEVAAEAQEETIIPEDDVPVVQDFITESNEHIELAESGLLELEVDPSNEEILNQIFRSFHTIKGMAGFLNLTEIGSIAHSAENLLDLARKGELVLVGKNTDAIFESIDMLKRMIGSLKSAIENGTAVASQSDLPTILVKLKALAEGQEVVETINTPEGEKNDAKLDEMLAVEDAPVAKYTAAPEKVKAKTHVSDEKIKVSTSRLDTLINMAGELVIAQLMVAEEATTKFALEHDLNGKVVHQGKIVRDLQELSMSMRMVPISGVFQKMARLVRDLSHKAGKQITFSTQGEETELDRNIVDKIADPLVHMIRNSADHGIESAEDRAAAGKSASGKVELRAFHQAGNIVIEIEDDGKGLDKELILQKAIANGIVEADQDLSDEEIFKLIFHAGLSTAKEITSVSGRGVGMDVVRKNIEALRGKIEISSTKGKGTTFTIRLPLTLAIIDGQIVKVGNERYIVPINSIVRTLRPKKSQLSTVQDRGEMVTEQGMLLPIVRMYELFGAVPITEDASESLLVVVEEDGKKCGLLVDELLGQQQVVIKSLGEGLGQAKGISGGAIMGDGRVSLILDIPGLMELAQK